MSQFYSRGVFCDCVCVCVVCGVCCACLPKSVLYCDTDSVMFSQDVDEHRIVRTGDYQSHLTDEMDEFGSIYFIQQFVSSEAKNYAFSVFCSLTRKRTTKSKMKFITLNYENSNVVNYTILRDMILKHAVPEHVHDPKKIKRKHVCVISEPEKRSTR